MIEVFAWVVMLIVAVSAIAMFFIAGLLLGYFAKSHNHPWAEAVTIRRVILRQITILNYINPF
ncbi:MAG: hypothetical protein WBQ24_01470 [Xanthobacteraceae bacterium]|jgi:hypothetical protein